MVKASNNIPWWVNAIYKVGVPTAIACYLVWFLTNRVQTNLEAINAAMTKHNEEQFIGFDNQKQMLIILRTMCVNGAKSNDERAQCIK